jgi:protein tweety
MYGYDNYLDEGNYKVPILAKILHSLPHLNITFHRTNNTFRPTDEIYLEVSII